MKKALSPLNVSSCCQTLMKVCCDKSSESSFDLIKEKIEASIGFYDNPYIRFEGQNTQQETFFVEDPNYNMLEIKSIQGTYYE